MRRNVVTAFVAAAVLAGSTAAWLPTTAALSATGSDVETNTAVPLPAQGVSQTPVVPTDRFRFEPNKGQFDQEVRFLSRGAGYTLFLTPTEAVMALQSSKETATEQGAGVEAEYHVVRMGFEGANPAPAMVATEVQPGVSNYLKGNDETKWVKGVPNYAKVTYRGIYPGVDLVYRGNDRQDLEYDFLVAPGADPSPITLAFSGHDGISLDSGGDLLVTTAGHQLRQHKPVVYQEAADGRRLIASSFTVDGSRVSFKVGDYDRAIPLVIDPVVTYSTYLGGGAADQAASVSMDAAGHVHVAGKICSADFKATKGSAQYEQGGGCDAFVTKLTPDGTQVVYTTYLGGGPSEHPDPGPDLSPNGTTHYYVDDGLDSATSIALDRAGHVYVTGDTNAKDFPVTETAYDRTCTCSEYLRSYWQYTGAVHGVEQTQRNWTGGHAPRQTHMFHRYVSDAFIAKLDANGSSLIYSTYLGGDADPGAYDNGQEPAPGPSSSSPSGMPSGLDSTTDIAVDEAGNAYVSGWTNSPSFPTVNAFDATCGNNGECDGRKATPVAPSPAPAVCGTSCSGANPLTDGFMARINTKSSGEPSLVYSTYLGGGQYDSSRAIALDTDSEGSPRAYVLGLADGTFLKDRGKTAGAFQTSASPNFVALIDTEAVGPDSIERATFIGPEGYSGAPRAEPGFSVPDSDVIGPVLDIATNDSGQLYLTGRGSVFPTPPPGMQSYQAAEGGKSDAFVAKLDGRLSSLLGFTYLGGSEPDHGISLAVDGGGNPYVVGQTLSSDFPGSRSLGPGDAFLAKLSPDLSTLKHGVTFGAPASGSSNDPRTNIVRAVAAGTGDNAVVAGRTSSREFPTTTDAYQPKFGGGVDAFVMSVDLGGTAPVMTSLSPNRGPTSGGTPVTISGRGFTGVDKVSFGVHAADFHVDSDTQISTTSPPQPDASVQVTVSRGEHTSAEIGAFGTFTYDEGRWAPSPSAPSGEGAAVLLDGPDCSTAAPPEYCGQVLASGSSEIRLFNPRTGAWSEANCSTPSATCPGAPATFRTRATTTLLSDGRVLFSGGTPSTGWNPGPLGAGLVASTGALKTAEVYDPADGTWSPTGDMAIGRKFHTATLLPGNKVLVVGGFNGASNGVATATAEIYDPDAVDPATTQKGRWSPTGSMTEDRGGHASILLAPPECTGARCGGVLVTGGSPSVGGVAKATAEFFDPELGAWVPAGSNPSFRRVGHSATLLPTGKVLFTGGGALMAEIYDPAAPEDIAWTFTGSMRAHRQYHASVLLPNGKVLVVGGDNVSLAEIYDVVNGSWRTAGTSHARSAVLLSGDAERFEVNDSCKPRCGKVLVGPHLYTPAPSISTITPASGDSSGGTEVTFTGTGLESLWGPESEPDQVRVLFDGRDSPEISRIVDYGRLSVRTPPISTRVQAPVMVIGEGGPVQAPSPFTYKGAPGAVGALVVVPRGDHIELRFNSAGSVAEAIPPATTYQLRRARTPIGSSDDFDKADELACVSSTAAGDCLLEPTAVGQRLSVTTASPPVGRTRYYAVRAANNDGEVGPFAVASYTSPGIAVDDVPATPLAPVPPAPEGCPAVAPGPGQVSYLAGYSLTSVPAGTVLGADSPLYSWFDQGARGNYTTIGSSAPTEAGRGYWAWFDCPSLVELAGSGADSVTLPLGAYRASMVGNPSGAGPATATGHDFAARWDPNLNAGAGGYHVSGYRQAQELAVGQAMWAFSYVATELSIRRR